MKKTTLKDIAKQLNISVSTVSRALQNNPRISIEVRQQVLKLANESNYFNTKYPQSFSLRKTNIIGIIVPKISYHLYAMAISGIEKIAKEHNMHILICQSDESYFEEVSLVNELMSIGVAGIIVSLASETKQFDHFLQIKKHGIPLVFFNRSCDDIDADKVIIDNFKASYDATNHLIAVGCKHIAFIGGPNILQISNTRLLGYKKALVDANIPVKEERIEHCNFTRESEMSAARKLFYTADYPDGIITFSDQIAINAMLAIKERGLRIPEDVSVIGINNEPIGELIEPSLSSINQPGYLMGTNAAKLIFERIKSPNKSFTKKVLNSQLVIRNSTNRNKI